MKTNLTLLLMIAISTLAYAEVDIPRTAIEPKDLVKAQETAKAEKKLIAYLHTDKNTTNDSCRIASNEFIKLVRSKAVIVYLDFSNKSLYWNSVPASVRTEMDKMKDIPKMVVTQADGTTVTATIGQDAFKADERAAVKDFKKGLKDEKEDKEEKAVK